MLAIEEMRQRNARQILKVRGGRIGSRKTGELPFFSACSARRPSAVKRFCAVVLRMLGGEKR
jgi:hypothetical protein